MNITWQNWDSTLGFPVRMCNHSAPRTGAQLTSISCSCDLMPSVGSSELGAPQRGASPAPGRTPQLREVEMPPWGPLTPVFLLAGGPQGCAGCQRGGHPGCSGHRHQAPGPLEGRPLSHRRPLRSALPAAADQQSHRGCSLPWEG